MCQPSSCKQWVVASALVCALAGIVLKATDPVQHHEPTPRLANQQPHRAVKRFAPDVASPSEPCERGDGLPAPSLAAAPADGLWLGGQPPRAAAAGDGSWFGAEPARAAFALALPPAAARVPADQADRREPTAERPALLRGVGRRLRAKHRRPARRRRGAEERVGGGSAGERPQGDTPPVPPATEPPARQATTVSPTAPASDDVAFHSGDDVQFPTAERVAIPIDGKLQHEGGSVSLWVQPGWERGNEDDATLVQLGDRLRLAKSVHFLRLEAADAEAPDAGDVAGVGVPITEWNPGEWHQVTATWNENALSLYVDGELVGRRMGRGHVDLPPDTELLVGSDLAESRRVAPGLIGRVDVRSRSLGDDEVARDYRDAVGQDERPAHGEGLDESGNRPHDRGKGSDDRGEGPDLRGGPDRGRSHEADRSASR
ncbi:MAG: LamG domain-containing protein [Deltaproteobacteria bacterium]|nr:MAG: LamG domain-containing protein [Deltaproteobacteria bacterium]